MTKISRLDLIGTLDNLDEFAIVDKSDTSGGTSTRGTTKRGTIALLGTIFGSISALDLVNRGNVKRYGATGDGVTDDTTFIQDAVDDVYATGGGSIYFPAGIYVVTDTITLPTGGPLGISNGQTCVSVFGDGRFNSIIDANNPAMYNKRVFHCEVNEGLFLRAFGINGPRSEVVSVNSIGIDLLSINLAILQDVDIFGCNVGLKSYFNDTLVLYHCHAREANTYNCELGGNSAINSLGITIHNSLFQVANPSGHAYSEPANILLNGGNNVLISGCLVDELGLNFASGGSSILINGLQGQDVSDIELHRTLVYAPGTQTTGETTPPSTGSWGTDEPYYGIHIGATAKRVNLRGVRVLPYVQALERQPTNTIKIDAGAEDIVLEDVVTVTNIYGGGDISDSGTRTVYRNCNGMTNQKRKASAFNANLAVSCKDGTAVTVAALTGNITVGAPTFPTDGAELKFFFTQDGTGGWTVAWNAVFVHSWSNTGNTAGKKASVEFVYDGTNWVQLGAQRAWA